MSTAAMVVREAEPPLVWEAANWLTHTNKMRNRLWAAMQELMRQPGLVGAPDSVRMTAVVLAARTSAADLTVDLTARELGRWVGVSASTIGHEVRPHLDREGITHSENRLRPGTRVITGIRWQLLPLRDARHEQPAEHPLRLQKVEFAVLWGLLEAVCAPGWSHRDGTQTPPGLLGRRTGRGAATDRLALLLLVLESRATGLVRLCGGAVGKHGRMAATIARLLGCSPATGAQVLDRLQTAGVVEARLTPAGREQLVIPAVEAAYREMRRRQRAAGRPGGLVPGPRRSDRSAGRDQITPRSANPQVRGMQAGSEGGASSAGLHAHHTPMAPVVDESAGGSSSSGYGRGNCCGLPECTCAREDQAVVPKARAVPVPTTGGDLALRAERQTPAPPPHSPLHRALGHQTPQVAEILARIVPSPSSYQRERLSQLVRGLMVDGDDDAMIAARLRERLQPLATGAEDRPYAFRRDGLSWALTIGLPYAPGGKTTLLCARQGCRGTVRAKATDTVRCDACEFEVMDQQRAIRARKALQAELSTRVPWPAVEQPAMAAQVPPPHSPPDSTAPQMQPAVAEPLLPVSVREQLQVLATFAPKAARAAETAAHAAYTPAAEAEAPAEYQRRVSAATATWCAITSHYAEQLAAAHHVEEHARSAT
ncbi:hypothetical protein [Streptomyces sp. NPDC059008]|uniref:hypothetical protein n=1 Tax=Streptomyces sp. NPDC059008 TaxID=3346693 RepID=UPI0036A7B4DC